VKAVKKVESESDSEEEAVVEAPAASSSDRFVTRLRAQSDRS
jgi:hypothetical protein